MFEIPLNNRTKLKDQSGFTLIELVMVILILSCLITLSLYLFRDIKERSADMQALAEGKNLLTAASDVFLANEDVLFTSADPHTGPVGTLKSDGVTARNSIYTISANIRATLTGKSTPQLGGRFLTYFIWSAQGSGVKYYFEIDEDNNVITIPSS